MGYIKVPLRFSWNKICLVLRNLFTFRIETVVVNSVQGDLRGKKCTSVLGKPYYSFQGVPYAKPPLGPLRFKDPEPPEPWEGVRNAVKEGPACCHFDKLIRFVVGSEDCLYLNVYTPQLPTEHGFMPKAVLVWIHGGAYAMGSSTKEIYSPDFFLEEDVILVTFNYRLGALGFLATGTEDVPGNAGLKDMVMALRWLQQNIAGMGGDPNRVCIFGESAGGSAVELLQLSPLCKGLFSSAISQSGSVLTPWTWSSDPIAMAFKLGKNLGCHTNDINVLIKFLRNVPASTLARKKNSANTEENIWEMIPFGFVPCAEPDRPNAFITKHPLTLLENGDFLPIPHLAGCNQMEGMVFLKQILDKKPPWSELEKNFDRFVPRYLKLEHDSEKKKQVAQKMRDYYLGDKVVDTKAYTECCHLLTDVFYLNPLHRTTQYMIRNSSAPVFNYYFLFDGGFKCLKYFLGSDHPGPAHGDELGYIFYIPLIKQNVATNSPELKVARRMVRMWSNFAKTSNPTPSDNDSLLPVKWEPVQPNKQYYLEISEELTLKEDIEKNRAEFWMDLHKFCEST